MSGNDDDDCDIDEKLLQAAKGGDSGSLEALVEAGADVNSRNKNRKTGCMLAAQYGHVGCLEILLGAGADVNARGLYDKTALLLAVETGQGVCVEKLIDAGADVNVSVTLGSIRGRTALMYAADRGHVHCTRLLLDAGADVNSRSKYNLTALMLAGRNGNAQCVEILAEAGADVNHTDNEGNTTLMLLVSRHYNPGRFTTDTIAEQQRIHTVAVLLKLGAHVNKTDTSGNSVLKWYITNNSRVNRSLATLLFAAGENFNDVTPGSRDNKRVTLPTFLQFNNDLKLCLKHQCREVIRRHLVFMNLHQNLFMTVPRLGLPSSLTSYLLYEISLPDKY